MRKFTFAAIAATGLAAATLGLAAPATAAPSGTGSAQDTTANRAQHLRLGDRSGHDPAVCEVSQRHWSPLAY
jgi:hypothetical protein